MKQLIALLMVVVILMGAAPAIAQGPVPIPPPPGSEGPGQPLPPMPVPIGQPLPKAPEQYMPTWQAPLPSTPQPTPVAFDWYDIVALQIVPVRTCPAMTCYVIGRLLSGEVVTVRWAGPDWVQVESGYLTGNYIPVDLNLWRPL